MTVATVPEHHHKLGGHGWLVDPVVAFGLPADPTIDGWDEQAFALIARLINGDWTGPASRILERAIEDQPNTWPGAVRLLELLNAP